jgi:hypothetical protein
MNFNRPERSTILPGAEKRDYADDRKVNMHRIVQPLFISLLVAGPLWGAPRWLRISWSTTDATDRSMTIAWTDDDPGGGVVEYRPLGGTATAITAEVSETASGCLGVTYEAVISELDPSSVYEYRVQSGGAWSAWKMFVTPPPVGSCDHIKFIVGGDGRGGEVFWDPGYVSRHWVSIAGYVRNERPNFMVYTGDFVHRGEEDLQWEEWFDVSEVLTSEVPLMAVIGNHDDGPGAGDNQWYTKMFAMPLSCAGRFDETVDPDGNGIEEIWAIVVGNVLMVALSTEGVDTAVQHSFLEEKIAEWDWRVDWKIVFFHRPLWSSGLTGNNDGDGLDADNLIGIIDDYDVDFVLCGHDHDYERFHPARGGYGGRPRIITPLPDDGGNSGIAQGPIHVVSGGFGSFTNFAMFCRVDGCHVANGNLNYMVFDIEGDRADVIVRDFGPILSIPDAYLRPDPIDQFTVYKRSTVCNVTPDETPEEEGFPEPVDVAESTPDASTAEDAAHEPASDMTFDDAFTSADTIPPEEHDLDPPVEETGPLPKEGCGCTHLP